MARFGPQGVVQRSLTTRLVLSFLLLSLVIVALVAGIAYVTARASLEASLQERLDAVADARADALDRWVDEQRRNVVFIGQLPGFGERARELLDGRTSAATRSAAYEGIAAVLGQAVRLTSDAEEFLLLDLDGTVRAATRPEYEGASQAGSAFFEEGASHTTVQPFYASTLTGRRTMTVGTPVFDQDGRGQRVAVLAANLNLERVDRIILEGSGLGQTGQAYLVGSDGRFVHPRLNVDPYTAGIASVGIDRAL
ncbi:MAG TPA: cache domain-containing protein, partial [Candidatus Limnocylindrales bacterium]|nr:cache domain-containing protein [Candidatus Limnocylindrales bacterium]